MNSSVLLIAFSLAVTNISAQKRVNIADMDFQYNIEDNKMICMLTAPTSGWMALGFNTKDDIFGADLKMMRIIDGKAQMEDQIVKQNNVHVSDVSEGGLENCILINGTEMQGKFLMAFKIPLNTGDKFDCPLKVGEEIWVILAYSDSDDFSHHSLKREHKKITVSR